MLQQFFARTSFTSIVLTEHAMLRYLERAHGINLEEVRAAIMTDRLVNSIKTLGSGKYPIGRGFKAVVKGSHIVTIIGAES